MGCKIVMIKTQTVTHSWEEETPEAKARWFQTLSLTERMNMFYWFTDLCLVRTRASWSKKMLNQWRGVYASLQKHKVRYVTIGGVAAILHGVPRTTFDLDILIEATLKMVNVYSQPYWMPG